MSFERFVAIAAFTGWGLIIALGLYGARARTIEPPQKQVVIEQIGNGYTVDLCIAHTPCPVTGKDRRIAKDAQGASAEVYAYLSGKPLQIDWGK